jgi:TrpR-related protein YerC/YecD
MLSKDKAIWDNSQAEQFVSALLAIGDATAMKAFLRDVMTEKEIIEISARLEAAKMLQNGAKYTEIVEATNLSTRTVARISDWLQNGCGGYASVLSKINTHRSHISPASAE